MYSVIKCINDDGNIFYWVDSFTRSTRNIKVGHFEILCSFPRKVDACICVSRLRRLKNGYKEEKKVGKILIKDKQI